MIPDTFDFDGYFDQQVDESAKVRPASTWTQEVVDQFYGEPSAKSWVPTGFDKMRGKFDLRPGEVTLWAGINGHGKTTLLSQVQLRAMQSGQKVGLASFEMKPPKSMAKMSRQAAGIGSPSIQYIRAFHRWTDNRLWIYDHLGRVATKRVLAVATYMRKELGIDHMVIDSLMKCGIGTDDYTAQKDFVNDLCSVAQETGLGIHLVVHMRKGENERSAPDKFDVKGASEIVDLVDNLVICWKNVRKLGLAEEKRDPDDPDAFVRIAKQRHHTWEGSFAFWFDPDTQQFREHQKERAAYLDLPVGQMEVA
ncbi:AAA family ATPase [Hydrogenophaga sp.]|uniref:AAA family ATPase n=1 Tax=Hydrogenophaga sp. TaxID=1904254 RepID=UPI0025BAF682|nr:AAA family ATPase [Hydrogenophaga sp.]